MAGRLFVLVVTPDPRLEHQALAAVRSAGCMPMLAHADEECPVALRRTQPDVVLLDSLHPCAASPEFYQEAAQLGARVIALAPDSRNDHARAIARVQNASCVTLPAEYDVFLERLQSAALV